MTRNLISKSDEVAHQAPESFCRLCGAVGGDHEASAWDRVVAASPNFMAIPSLGALVDGWVLVVPRTHVLSMSALSESLSEELNAVVDEVSRKLARIYGLPVVAFEHGAVHHRSSVGCGVDHAHLHLVPLATPIGAAVLDEYGKYDWKAAPGSPGDLGAYLGHEYVWYKDIDGDSRIALGVGQSQMIRRVIARLVGAPDRWNWREHPAYERAETTAADLAPSFQGSLLVGSG